MNTCQTPQNLAAAQQPVATDPTLADLHTSQHRKMLITGQKLVSTFDKLTTPAEIDGSFFAEQLQLHFGNDIQTLRGCISNALMLADHTDKTALPTVLVRKTVGGTNRWSYTPASAKDEGQPQ